MNETYCGKNCDTCAQREAFGCPGGCGCPFPSAGECPIADCCREKGHASCATCTAKSHCMQLSGRDEMPRRKYEKRCADAARQEQLRQMAPAFAKWVWILFWTMILNQAVSLLTMDSLLGLLPWLEWPCKIVEMTCSVLMFVVLFRLAPYERQYRVAAWCFLATVPISVVTMMLKIPGEVSELLVLLIAVVNGILIFYANYKEYHANAAVLVGLDDELSEKWIRLWDWVKYSLLALGVGLILGFIGGLIGLIVILGAAIGLLVVVVRDYIYTYRMAQAFRAFAAQKTE